MNPGLLRNRITIKRSEVVGNQRSWVDIADCWAYFQSAKAKLEIVQGAVASVMTHNVTIRRNTEIFPGCRFEMAGVTYQVISVDSTDKAFTVMSCMEVDRFETGYSTS